MIPNVEKLSYGGQAQCELRTYKLGRDSPGEASPFVAGPRQPLERVRQRLTESGVVVDLRVALGREARVPQVRARQASRGRRLAVFHGRGDALKRGRQSREIL